MNKPLQVTDRRRYSQIHLTEQHDIYRFFCPCYWQDRQELGINNISIDTKKEIIRWRNG